MSSSRFIRPPRLPALSLTMRDEQVLELVHDYGLLTADHIRTLAFPASSRRIAQDRLRRLWAHGYVDRLYATGVLPRRTGERLNFGEPTYTVTKKGSRVLGRAPHHGPNRPSLATLQHHLVAVALLVSLAAADPTARVYPEGLLRRLVAVAPRGVRPLLVPDGAVTLMYAGGAEVSYLIEVVRAPAKRGNAALQAKLRAYRDRLRTDWFLKTYGIRTVRAVIIVAPTRARSDHYQELAAELSPGRGLFWFAPYEAVPSVGPPITRFAPESILDLPFQDGAGRTFTFRNPLTPSHV